MEEPEKSINSYRGTGLIVSHDSGGADILSSLVKNNIFSFKACLDGPAKSIFNNKIGAFDLISLKDGIKNSDWVITSTSWASDLEYQAIKQARKDKKFVVSLLDHWVNYKQRFNHYNSLILPNEIWVCDQYAYNLANDIFSNTLIKLIKNPLLLEFKKEFKFFQQKIIASENLKLLFLSDNIEEALSKQYNDSNYWGYTDKTSFEFLYENFTVISNKISQITIRSHPSESINNYHWALDRYGPFVKISNKESLAEDIANHNIIAGSESMAMVLALYCGKDVICCIPPGGKSCALPHKEILILNRMI